jgi:putative ABC transport system ATP-binding protein
VAAEVLRGVRLDVHPGDLVSVMGPSGCGKSTLMHILGLLDRPTSGSYFLNGRATGGMSDSELSGLRNASIGFVFQSFHLLPRLTAWENVAVPLIYRNTGSGAMRRRAREMLDKVGMGDRLGHRPAELSGGQQQRVAIARALVGTPDILLADEPTGALDAETGREIMRLFVRLNETEGLTAIVITHDRDVARQCARHLRMVDGVLSEVTERSAGAAAQPEKP